MFFPRKVFLKDHTKNFPIADLFHFIIVKIEWIFKILYAILLDFSSRKNDVFRFSTIQQKIIVLWPNVYIVQTLLSVLDSLSKLSDFYQNILIILAVRGFGMASWFWEFLICLQWKCGNDTVKLLVIWWENFQGLQSFSLRCNGVGNPNYC